MPEIKIGDKVTSHLSMWKNEIGVVSGVISKDVIHVIFPENDKHYGYQQTFSEKNLRLIESK